MIDESALNKSVRDTINLIVGDSKYPVIEADQNAPRPPLPHCTVKILNIKTDSLEEWEEENTETNLVTLKSRSMRRAMVSLKFFYGSPYNKASLVKQGFIRQSILLFLTSQKLGLGKRTSVRNENSPLENGYEKRAGFDVYFSFVEHDSEVLGTIGEIEITGLDRTIDVVEPVKENL